MLLAILFHFFWLNMFRTLIYPFTLMLNTPSLQNKTTNVVIQQNSRKLLMMDILMSETCWAHKKWNKIASDIELVFYSSTITMMHGPTNIRYIRSLYQWDPMVYIKFKSKASQARSIYHYKKLKIKVLNCNADIFFNNVLPKRSFQITLISRSPPRHQPHIRPKVKLKSPESKKNITHGIPLVQRTNVP